MLVAPTPGRIRPPYDTNDKNNLTLEFRHDLLNPARVEVPLFFVNLEARGIALAWVCGQGIEMCFYEDEKCHMFVRQLDQCVIYYILHLADGMTFAASLTIDYSNPIYSERMSAVVRTSRASPSQSHLFEAGPTSSPRRLGWFSGIKVLFVIVGSQLGVQLRGEEVVKRRWEIISTQERGFFWNHDHGRFVLGDGDCIGSKALYRHIQAATKGLGEKIIQNHIRHFEVRPVSAVKR